VAASRAHSHMPPGIQQVLLSCHASPHCWVIHYPGLLCYTFAAQDYTWCATEPFMGKRDVIHRTYCNAAEPWWMCTKNLVQFGHQFFRYTYRHTGRHADYTTLQPYWAKEKIYLSLVQIFVVICLGQGADLHVAQLMPLPLTYRLLQ